MRWIQVDPTRSAQPLTARQSGRAAGVLLGMAVADGWNHATELAVCVADAAATGRALTDLPVLERLRRNLHALELAKGSFHETADSANDVLAASAVVALAHVHDSPSDRMAATTAVLGILNPDLDVDNGIHRWVEIVTSAIRSGQTTNPSSILETGATYAAIADAVKAVSISGPHGDEFVEAIMTVPGSVAAAGSLIGATHGWEAIPDKLAEGLTGWPESGGAALLALGLQIPRLRARSVQTSRTPAASPDGRIPVERWNSESGRLQVPAELAPAHLWHRSAIVLTTADAETRDNTNDGQVAR